MGQHFFDNLSQEGLNVENWFAFNVGDVITVNIAYDNGSAVDLDIYEKYELPDDFLPADIQGRWVNPGGIPFVWFYGKNFYEFKLPGEYYFTKTAHINLGSMEIRIPGAKDHCSVFGMWGVNVIYDANGGSNPPPTYTYEVYASVPYPSRIAVPIPYAEPTRPGYIFKGWNNDPTNPRPELKYGDTIYPALNPINYTQRTLYAVWEKKFNVWGKSGGAWKQASNIWVKNSGTWKVVNSAWAKSGGTWRQ